MPAPTTAADPIARIAHAVMLGVARSGAVRSTNGPDDNTAAATEIMKAEVKALLFADDYAGARQAVLERSLHEGYAIGLVVANCIAKIHAAAR